MKKIILFTILSTILFSCEKDDVDTMNSNGIPSYINIPNFILDDEDTTHNITDAWVYINEQLQGVYELPVEIPILANKEQNLRIKAGIKINGISATRSAYPYYSSYIDESFVFESGKTTTIVPIVSYTDSAKSRLYVENFEPENNSSGYSIENTNNSDTVFEVINEGTNHYAIGALSDSISLFEITNIEGFSELPSGNHPVFIELLYKNNTRFQIGLYINKDEAVEVAELIWVAPKDEWSKIYVNITNIINSNLSANSFKVFIKMERDFDLSENYTYFDNLKLVY